jgi:hypothetical protein
MTEDERIAALEARIAALEARVAVAESWHYVNNNYTVTWPNRYPGTGPWYLQGNQS